MRVAILGSRGFPSTYGGFETFVRRFAPFLREFGDEVTVYAHSPTLRALPAAVIDGGAVVARPGSDHKALATPVNGLTSSLHARLCPYDAMLVLNCANGFWLPLLRSKGCPVAVNVDGIEWQRAKWGRVAKRVFRTGAVATARHADAIIADSLEIGRIWRETFHVEPHFIPYGADVVTDVRTERVSALGLEPGHFVLAVARLVPENNVDLLLNAVEHLGPSVPVVVAGSANYDSPVVRRLQRFAERRAHVLTLGHVWDQDLLEQLWASCAVYFHGHSVGGTNPALLQALGYGSPTIALDTPFNREVLASDDQLVGHRPALVADRIREVFDDTSRQRVLRERGREIVGERYRWEDVCQRYREVLSSLASGRLVPA